MNMSTKEEIMILDILRARGEGMSFSELRAEFLKFPDYANRTGREFRDELETRLKQLKEAGHVGIGYSSSGGPDNWHIWLKGPSKPGWA